MKIGIIGAGAIGQAFGRHVAKSERELLISNSRGPDSLGPVVRALGGKTRAAFVREAAAADIVFLSVPWGGIERAVEGLPDWGGRIVIDPTNAVGFNLGGRLSTEVVSSMLPGARVVKAFNTLTPSALGSDPRQAGGRRVIFISGNDLEAKRVVGGLASELGFAPVDLGTLQEGGRLQQFPGGPLPTLNLLRVG